jgi:IS5 family transposase
MITSKSPRKVLKLAYRLAQRVLPSYASPFSRKDFTRPQLFACLVLREHQKKSYRGIEALLIDSPSWLSDIGLDKAPDHNTLSRAFNRFMKPKLATSMLDLMGQMNLQRKKLKGKAKPMAMDSSLFESHHVSRHFERRRRDTARAKAKKARGNGA